MIGVARMKRDNAEKDLIEAEARVIQLRNASAAAAGAGANGQNNMDVDLAVELEEATQALNDCERLVDVTSDELQRSVSLYVCVYLAF